jgi:hypothetical protein
MGCVLGEVNDDFVRVRWMGSVVGRADPNLEGGVFQKSVVVGLFGPNTPWSVAHRGHFTSTSQPNQLLP